MIVRKSFAGTGLNAVIGNIAASAVAFFADGKHLAAVAEYYHSHNLVALFERNGAHAAGCSADCSGVVFVKADAHALFGGDHQLLVAVGQLNPAKLVALVKVDGDNSAFSYVLICVKLRSLDNSVFGSHTQIIAAAAEIGNAKHCRYLFVGVYGKNVHYIHSLAGTGALGYLISFEPVHLACRGKEQNVIVRGADKHGFRHILLPAVHTLDTLAATALNRIGFNGLALDVSHLCKGINAVLLGYQVLNINLARNIGDFGFALVGIFSADLRKLLFKYGVYLFLGRENFKVLLDFGEKLVALGDDFLNFKAGKLT